MGKESGSARFPNPVVKERSIIYPAYSLNLLHMVIAQSTGEVERRFSCEGDFQLW